MTDTAPTAVIRTLKRLPNATYRLREYLTESEVDRLIEAARKRGRNGARDAAAILLAYRHGLRAAELARSAGRRSISGMVGCMSTGPRAVRRVCIRYMAQSLGL
jgi:site-specific recombinase XerC